MPPLSTVEETPTRKRRRGRLVVWGGLAAFGVLALMLTLFTLANRPHWRTVTLAGKPGDTPVAFDCPDDWVIVDRYPETTRVSDGTARLTLRREPPTGWLRWWNAHVLHLSEHPFNSPEIEVEVLPVNGLEVQPVVRLKFDTSLTAVTSFVLSNYHRRTERVSHPLGFAVHRTVDINLNTPGRGTLGGKTWLPKHIESLDIYPSEAKEQRIGPVTISCAAPTAQYSQFKPFFDRVMQSVRLVR